MSRAKAIGAGIGLFLVGSVGLANLLHHVVFPPEPPDPATYPRAGDVFASAVEGFRMEVNAERDGWLVLRLEIAPGAPGPPMHYHRSFREVFTVESGTLHLELPEGVVLLEPGKEYSVEPGVLHRPHNPAHEKVIVASDKPAMPQSFGACLVQIYHFLDAAEGRMSPGLMVRIAALDPICDTTVQEVPAVIRIGTKWLVVPFARAFGFENYYRELSLHPGG